MSKLRDAKLSLAQWQVLEVANKEGRDPKAHARKSQIEFQLYIYSIKYLSVIRELNCEIKRGVFN